LLPNKDPFGLPFACAVPLPAGTLGCSVDTLRLLLDPHPASIVLQVHAPIQQSQVEEELQRMQHKQ
jgi:hypothetical protein